MGTNDYDMNFLVGNDLGNAVCCQWLRRTLSEEKWSRVFDHSQSVNEERAGDAVEVCLATLYFTTLFPLVLGGSIRELCRFGALNKVIRRFCVLSSCDWIAKRASYHPTIARSD